MNRRNFIKASGSLIFLPSLSSTAAEVKTTDLSKLLFIGYGYGPTHDWYPDTKQVGKKFDLTRPLEPLKEFKEDFSIISNLSHRNGRNVHGSCQTFLTGADTSRVRGKVFHNDVSCDYVAATKLGLMNRFTNLVLSGKGGGTGRGLSMTWDAVGNPVAGITDPVQFFNIVFSDGTVSKAERLEKLYKKQSVLDTVVGQMKGLQSNVSKKDRSKLDEYLTGVRDIETRLRKDIDWIDVPPPKATMSKPGSGLEGYRRLEVMADIMVAALQTNQTRVSSLRIGSDDLMKQLCTEVGSRMSGHNMSHYGSDDARRKASERRDILHSQFLAHVLKKMKSIKTTSGKTLLDSTIVTMGSGVRNKHGLKNLPILVAGGTSGLLKQGQHIVMKELDSRLSNLWLTLLKQSGAGVDSFSDSNGLINELV
ncbi:MAG: DUF1552 domain-containing protein [Lentisphaeraceae bacterium]|nr:DUF1552 domain-containing protein [Lentisphaeraceae bacterium]